MRILVLFSISSFLTVFKVEGLKDRPCATFSRENGESKKITENQHVSDLELGFQSSSKEPSWVPFKSFSVSKECSATVCSETDFDGICSTVRGDGTEKKPDGFDEIRSASCTCSLNCKCSDQYIRNTGCARAYINHNCNVCQSNYLDLRKSKPSILPEIRNNISSIIVRPGCTLVTYPEEDLQGDPTTLDGITKESWSETIASYECECTEPNKKKPVEADKDWPQMIDIPNTLDEISKLFSTSNRHPGLAASLKSYKGKRSQKNAYILLLGLTGSGKSSAINLLFDNPNVTKVGDAVSTTSDIHEFRIPVPVPELGIANSELRVIDTPGLGDTRGLEQDARFLATLDDYLSGHEELSHRMPNVVLIFGKFNDNRFSGKGSVFVKMLSGFESFRERVTDKSYSNVIFVLSHFMSALKETTRRPAQRIKLFKSVIEEYSLLPRPTSIVIAENKAEAQDLLMVNGFFKLPNGDYYPRNLFDKIQQVTTNGEDPIGEAIIRAAFRDSDDFNITAHHFRLVNSAHGKTLKYIKLLTDSIFTINQTEVSQILAKTEVNMPENLKISYPDALPYIQKAFNLRKIHSKSEVPKTKLEIIKFLKDIKQNEANMWLIKNAFGIQAPSFHESLVTGHSYNVIEDSVLAYSPFLLGENLPSDTGYVFPSALSCEIRGESVGIFHIFQNKKDYIESRLKNLGVQGSIYPENYKGQLAPGSNLVSDAETVTITAMREHRNFELILNNNYKLTPEFIKVVKGLKAFNESSVDSVEEWKDFFQKYGTHVVKSAYGGGSIEIKLTSTSGLNSEIADSMFALIKFAEDVSIGQVDSNSTLKMASNNSHSLKFSGGDHNYHTSDLKSMSLGSAARLLENWKESINLSPAILKTDLKLMSLSQIVKKIPGQTISSEIDRAVSILFNANLKVVVKPKSGDEAPVDRQHTTGPSQSNNNGMFNDFLKIMLETQAKNDERMQLLLAQMAESSKQNELRRAEADREEQRWRREQAEKQDEIRRLEMKDERDRKDRREQLDLEYRQRQDEQRVQREKNEREYRMQQERMRQEADARQAALLAQIASRPTDDGCLRENTKISLYGGGLKLVQDIKAGDILLDGELKPTNVIGASFEYIQSQTFFSFSDTDTEPFFTNSHLFMGQDGGNFFKLYAQSPEILLKISPLMKYMNVSGMGKGFNVRVLNENNEIITKFTTVREIDMKPAPDTKVYFIEVDSPTGTYFANGYMSHHEIPPFYLWPRTMPILFTILEMSETIYEIVRLEHTYENLKVINEIVTRVENRVKELIEGFERNFENYNNIYSDANGFKVKKLEEFDLDEIMPSIYSNPSTVSFAYEVYGRVGKMIADFIEDKKWSEKEVAKFQILAIGEIYSELTF